MCQRVTCRTCKKPTYEGCGLHAERVLVGVPRPQRCACDRVQGRPCRSLFPWLRRR